MIAEELFICCGLWAKVVAKEFYSLKLRKISTLSILNNRETVDLFSLLALYRWRAVEKKN